MASEQSLVLTIVIYVVGQRKTCRIKDSSSSSRSSQSSKISVEYVSNVLERLKQKQTRESTANNYLCVWRQLNRFLISLDSRESLSWEEKTALFGAYLVDGGVQSSTLKFYFSAIKHILKQDGYVWDSDKMLLSSLIRGCQLENDSVKIRLPIQKGLFEMLLFEMERKFGGSSPQPYLEIMYKAIFCLGYYGMLRVGEMTLGPHTVKAGNIHVGHNKDEILIVLYTSKTHGKESGPQKVKISARSGRHMDKQFFCPFKSVIDYMLHRGNYDRDEEQFFVFADGSPVRPNNLRCVLRSLLDALDLNSQLYDVHSFRIGRTCDLFKYGYSIEQIKAMGRWKSNAVYKYLKTWNLLD